MSWADAVLAREFRAGPSPHESSRFGLSVARAVAPPGEAEADGLRQALAHLATSEADLVVLRYPAERVAWFAALRASGRDLLHADTLTYWSLPVGSGHDPGALPPGMRAGSAQEADVDAFVGEVFAGYGNHYLADPLLDEDAALAGYREWARRSAREDLLVTLHDDHGVAGLATVTAQEGHCEILLAGIRTDLQSRGLYAWLLAACEDLASRHGASDLVISTQAHNVRVQRAWSRHGFRPAATLTTVHALRPGLLDARRSSTP